MSESYMCGQKYTPVIVLERVLLRFAVNRETAEVIDQTSTCIVCSQPIQSGYAVSIDNGYRDRQEVGMCCNLCHTKTEVIKAAIEAGINTVSVRLNALLHIQTESLTVKKI
ncbi:MAG: hypothetical protein WCG48_02210 [Candidatus Berkelbacteria bacterium]